MEPAISAVSCNRSRRQSIVIRITVITLITCSATSSNTWEWWSDSLAGFYCSLGVDTINGRTTVKGTNGFSRWKIARRPFYVHIAAIISYEQWTPTLKKTILDLWKRFWPQQFDLLTNFISSYSASINVRPAAKNNHRRVSNPR